ncbi:Vps51/Vps67-domain-containing protein, partial [Spinellus fusiger]
MLPPAMSPQSPDQVRKAPLRERNINLKNYYGISTPEEISQPLDIDSAAFNSAKYFAKLVKESPLNELMQHNRKITGDIREIDGDMKTLVYENYSKFISATDTIQKMKSNIETMESEMDHLNEKMNSLTNHCTDIHSALGPKRDKIFQLSNTHNQLKRLQFIFDLPNRLNRCLSSSQYSLAVKYYAKATQLLDHYQHMTAFKGIEEDCHAIITKVTAAIELEMQQDQNVESTAESIRLLLLLKQDRDALQDRYLQLQIARISTKKLSNETSAEELVEYYITPLEAIVYHFKALFIDRENPETPENDTRERIKKLVEAAQPCTDQLFDLVSELIVLPETMLHEERPLRQFRTLQLLNEAIHSKGKDLCSLLHLDQRMNQIIIAWEDQLVDRYLCTVVSGMQDRLCTFSASFNAMTSSDLLSATVHNFIVATEAWCTQYIIHHCLVPLSECIQEDILHNKPFAEHVSYGLNTMWNALADILATVSEKEETKTKAQVLRLVSARLCYHFTDPAVIVSTFQPKKNEGLVIESTVEDQQVIDRFSHTGQHLLNEQMMLDGYTFSSMIQVYYLSLLSHPTTEPSSLWVQVLQRLQATEHLVRIIFPSPILDGRETSDSDYEYRLGSHSSALEAPVLQKTHSNQSFATLQSESEAPGKVSKFGNDTAMNMMQTIHKLFADRVDVYNAVEPSVEGFCGALVRILLKAFQEVVREMWVDCNIYQQLQVDVEYLGMALQPYAGDEKTSTSLRDIVSNAHSRCSNPLSLSPEELERLL